jgi:TPR repeat protein
VQWFRLAADQGHAGAQYNLGIAYANGLGVSEDISAGVTWFQRAADQGHAAAQGHLGIAYANGLGVMRDTIAAVQWYLLAGDRGFAPARDYLMELQTIVSRADLAEAMRRAREWTPTPQP